VWAILPACDGRLRQSLAAKLVADAKYTLLADSADRPTGVDRGDLYQLISYLSRYAPAGDAVGTLIYPRGDSPRLVDSRDSPNSSQRRDFPENG